ncbi:MAG: hypothetical protein HY930_06705 [Euryarchaeota archaeon]|nr:hypothetical protein [Euryarchaeota archaeon]
MIKGIFYIEAQGNHEKFVKDSLKVMAEGLKKEEKVKVRREFFDEVIKEGESFSSTAEVDLEFEDFQTYVLSTIKYAPSAIEIREPEELTLSAEEFVRALAEIIKVAKMFYAEYSVGFKFPERHKKVEVGLSEDEIDALRDQDALRAKIIVESKGKSEKKVASDFVNIVSEDVFVNKVKAVKIDDGKEFSGLVGIDAFMYEPKTLIDLSVRHTPVLVEIVEPNEIVLSMLDIQDIGVDLAGVFFEAAQKLVLGGN